MGFCCVGTSEILTQTLLTSLSACDLHTTACKQNNSNMHHSSKWLYVRPYPCQRISSTWHHPPSPQQTPILCIILLASTVQSGLQFNPSGESFFRLWRQQAQLGKHGHLCEQVQWSHLIPKKPLLKQSRQID